MAWHGWGSTRVGFRYADGDVCFGSTDMSYCISFYMKTYARENNNVLVVRVRDRTKARILH